MTEEFTKAFDKEDYSKVNGVVEALANPQTPKELAASVLFWGTAFYSIFKGWGIVMDKVMELKNSSIPKDVTMKNDPEDRISMS